MKEQRAVAKWFAGALVVGTIAVGGVTPAQAMDTGWNGTVAPANSTPTLITRPSFKDTGWNGT